ncbi:MAG: hypothetical protein AB9866_01985 [Syntrophobacteraceae bacterium]
MAAGKAEAIKPPPPRFPKHRCHLLNAEARFRIIDLVEADEIQSGAAKKGQHRVP